MDFLGEIASGFMTPLYYATTAVLLAWHWLFGQVISQDSGWTWALAIVGLTATIRALLIPLYIRHVKSTRAMHTLQPQIEELQQKYGHDRERLTQEQMKLWKESGTNPFASCLPLLLQLPIFFALFRVIDQAAGKGAGGGARGFLSSADAESLQEAVFAGARVGDTLMTFDPFNLTESSSTRVLAVVLIVAMSATQYFTQWQLLHQDMPPDTTGPYVQQRKMLLYALPAVFAVGGLAFPLGVLLHWTTWNLWTMGEQSYVIRNDPAPGSGRSGHPE